MNPMHRHCEITLRSTATWLEGVSGQFSYVICSGINHHKLFKAGMQMAAFLCPPLSLQLSQNFLHFDENVTIIISKCRRGALENTLRKNLGKEEMCTWLKDRTTATTLHLLYSKTMFKFLFIKD